MSEQEIENKTQKNVEITQKSPTTRQEIIERLQEIVTDASNATRQELDQLKQSFYRLQKVEEEEQLKSFVAEGGDEKDFKRQPDETEEQFRKLMNIIKENRAAAAEALEAFRQENYKKKLELLEQIKKLIEKADTEGVPPGAFKELTAQWKEIKEIPADKATELWKAYQQYAEQFYDIQRLNSEFREYDFKKNLETKLRICEKAEALVDREDVVEAFRELQKLHQEFRETGPVAKESREEIWARFKAASTKINKRHQAHFEEIKKKEQENLDQKVVICEIIEAIDCNGLTKLQQWNDKTQQILALQEKWKTIGFATHKQNTKVYERYRAACNTFFSKKAEFFKEARSSMNDNLAKKTELCEQVEALKDSTDWKETAQKISDLQKQWKEIGPVPKKYSTQLWNRFIGACNHFYEQRDNTLHSQRAEENNNLRQKKDIIAKLKGFDIDAITDEAREEVASLVSRFNELGHVPYKLKETISEEYKKIYDKLASRFDLKSSQKSRGTGGNRSSRVDNGSIKDKLMHQYEALKAEIQTYENNLGFLNASSASGNSLVSSVKEKIDKLKLQADELLKQIESSVADAADRSETEDKTEKD